MYKYSKKSSDRLSTCHPDLQKIFNEAIKHMDITILEGVRSKERQEELVRTGKSKTLDSRHLKQDDGYSHAVDASPYPINWSDEKHNMNRWYMFVGFIKGLAAKMDIDIRCGGDWDGDGTTSDQTFHDLPHFEIRKK